jgi:Spy/CpxP family protein refolding chaperone
MHPFHRAWRSPGHTCHPKHVGWSHGGCDRGGDSMGHGPDEFEGGFGVRRPLRFLAHKLELDDAQVATLARVLDELKTERAQAAVDGRRALAELADAISADPFDAAKAQTAGERRVKSAERLRDAVQAALRDIHAALTPEQRTRFAYLIRTGALSV